MPDPCHQPRPPVSSQKFLAVCPRAAQGLQHKNLFSEI